MRKSSPRTLCLQLQERQASSRARGPGRGDLLLALCRRGRYHQLPRVGQRRGRERLGALAPRAAQLLNHPVPRRQRGRHALPRRRRLVRGVLIPQRKRGPQRREPAVQLRPRLLRQPRPRAVAEAGALVGQGLQLLARGAPAVDVEAVVERGRGLVAGRVGVGAAAFQQCGRGALEVAQGLAQALPRAGARRRWGAAVPTGCLMGKGRAG